MHELKDIILRISTTRVTDIKLPILCVIFSGMDLNFIPIYSCQLKMFLASSELFNAKVLSGYNVTLKYSYLLS